jgi:hypothetical protein
MMTHGIDELRELQRQVAGLIMTPLTEDWGMSRKSLTGRDATALAERMIKPSEGLDSFGRLEIYSRCYWYRLLDSLYDDFPGLLSILGNESFLKMAKAYLTFYPSTSFTMRNLGASLERFLTEEPRWAAPREKMAIDMVRFEWAQIVAFDGPARKPLSMKELDGVALGELRIGLQPYLTLLQLDHAVDEYLISVKKTDEERLRSGTSHASSGLAGREVRDVVPHPRSERIHLAVHRYENSLYYKRLEPGAYACLTALSHGASMEDSCILALKHLKETGVNERTQLAEWFRDWAILGWLTAWNYRGRS